MNPSLIQDCGYELSANQRQILTIPCADALAGSGLTLAAFTTFTLTVREDPGWPRSGMTLNLPLDPANAGGTPLLTVTGTPDGTNVKFTATWPTNPGRKRYAMDMWGSGGTAGDVQLLRATWLTLLPSVK